MAGACIVGAVVPHLADDRLRTGAAEREVGISGRIVSILSIAGPRIRRSMAERIVRAHDQGGSLRFAGVFVAECNRGWNACHRSKIIHPARYRLKIRGRIRPWAATHKTAGPIHRHIYRSTEDQIVELPGSFAAGYV